jgi:lysophospholipase L1-like esterase
MKCRIQSAAPSTALTIDTSNSSNQLAWFDLSSLPAVNGNMVACSGISGKVAVFGGLFSLGSTGLQMGNLAKGGRTLESVAAQDSAMRQQWFTALKPAFYLLNGGANDRVTRTPAQHQSDLQAIIADIKTASPDTKVFVIQPNEPSDAATTYFLDYVPVKQAVASATGSSYFDIRDVVGSLASATSNGFMLDGTHPNDTANKLIAPFIAQKLGYALGGTDPGQALFPY